MPAPSRTALETYIRRFLSSLPGRAKVSARTLVEKIGLVSYAEAQEFCLDVRRQLALGGDKATVKLVIAELNSGLGGAPSGDRGVRVNFPPA